MKKIVTTPIVAGVVIKQDGKYLLVQENRPGTPVHGTWNLPAGLVDEGDSIEKTAVKEAKEEVGYDVGLVRKIGIFQESTATPPKHAFEAHITGGKLEWPKDEILDARWFSWQEIQSMREKLRSDWIEGAISALEQIGRTRTGIGIMILKDGKVLLGKRRGSHGGGEYAFPGGHLEYMESFEDCALREIREECGIEVKNLRFQLLANMTKYAPKHYVHIGLIADWKSGEPRVLEPEKLESWDWYALDKLPQPMFETTRAAAESYKNGKNYFDSTAS